MHHFVANKFQKYRSSIIKTRFLKLTALKKGERRERQKNNFNKNIIKSLMPCYSHAITTHLMRCSGGVLAIFYIICTYYTTIITSFDRDFMEVRPTIIGIINLYTMKYLYLYARLILPFYMEKQSSGKVGTKMPDF